MNIDIHGYKIMSEQLQILMLRREETAYIQSQLLAGQLDKDWKRVKICSKVLLERWRNGK